MSISNYIPTSVCGYKFSKLKNVVYLVSKDHVKDVHIDGGDAYIMNLEEPPLKVECTSVEFTEQESLDERYKFSKTLKFIVNGYANVNSLEGGCYAIIVTQEGTYYMTNVDFAAKVTFTYNLTSKKNETEFTLSSQSNYPTLELKTSLEDVTRKCKTYSEYGVESINLIEKDYVTLNDRTSIITLFGGRKFKTVEFLKDACTLQESWDGEKCTDTLSFDIALDDYKTSWQYNLLEFTDNLYAGMVTPKSDTNAFFLGFNFGLQPSYSIQSTTNTGETNKITITLVEESVHGMYTLENPRIVEDSDTTWQYTDYVYEYATYECIDYNTAIYLAMVELDSNNNPTGNYKVLEGYEDRFAGLFNIVGTFSERVTFFTTKCSWFNSCEIIGNMPRLLTFIGTVCHTYTFGSTCDWHFENIPSYLNFSRTSGSAGVLYAIQVCNTLYTDHTVVGAFDMVHGNRRDVIDVQIISGTMKLLAYYTNERTYALPCDGSAVSITQGEVRAFTGATYRQMYEAIIGNCVERVDDYAFYQCSGLTSFTLANSVKYIDPYAFEYDNHLVNINLTNSVLRVDNYAFYGCSGATSLNLGNSLQYIGSYAFGYDKGLTSAYIPNSVTSMGSYSFSYCSGLTSVHLPQNGSLNYVPNGTFYECNHLPSVTIPYTYYYIYSYAFYGCSGLSQVNLSSNLYSIGSYAFSRNISLSGITLPQSLRTIESNAFEYDRGLQSFRCPSGVTSFGSYTLRYCNNLDYVIMYPMTPPSGGYYAFEDTNNCPIYVHCDALRAYQTTANWSRYAKRYRPLETECPIKMDAIYTDGTEFLLACDGNSALTQTEVDYGGSNGLMRQVTAYSCDNSVTTIGDYAFDQETNLTSVTLASSIVNINNYAFRKNTSLPKIEFIDNVQYIGSYSFSGCTSATSLRLGNSLSTVGTYTFSHCSSLSAITWGGSLSYINSYDFEYCSSLTNLSFYSSNIQAIYAYAFRYCTNLLDVNFNRYVYLIGNYAFSYCYSLTGITWGDRMQYIYDYAFSNCTSLPYVNIPNTVTYLGNGAFYSCSNLKTATIGTGVSELNNYTFEYCTTLSSVTMSNNVTRIGQYTFAYCYALSGITLSSNLQSIDNYAFYNDNNLRSIHVPANVTSMGNNIFNNCTSLEGIWMHPLVPPTLNNSNSFNNTNNCPIYVPCCSLEAYQTASQWSNVRSRLRGWDYGTCEGGCPIKYDATYNNNSRWYDYCDMNHFVSSAQTRGHSGVTSQEYYNIKTAWIGECNYTISAITFSGCTSMTAVTIPNTITKIGYDAFRYTGLPTLTIPNSVTEIGTYGLSYNYSLTSLTLSNSLTTINAGLCCGDTVLTGITLPQSIQSIQSDAFRWCWSINGTVTIPNRCTSIGSAAFASCYNLDYIVIPSGVTSIGSYAFSSCTDMQYAWVEPLTPPSLGTSAFTNVGTNENYPIYVHCCALGAYQKHYEWKKYKTRLRPMETPCEPKLRATYWHTDVFDLNCNNCGGGTESLSQTEVRTTITDGASGYYHYSGMTRAEIGGCCTSIDSSAFQDCIGLEFVTMGDGVTSLGSSAFYNCNTMSGITLSNNLTTINGSTFAMCTSLSGVTLPSSVTSIGNYAFQHCANMEGAFTIPNGVTYIGSYAFDNCHHITSVNIPYGVSYIYSDTFNNCIKLNSVTIPNSVTRIESQAFRLCISLTGITLPTYLTYIGTEAFESCEKLTSVNIPANVTNIGARAFYNCSGLTSIYVNTQKPPTLDGEAVFDNTNDCPIYVPCYDSYSTAPKWSEYAGRMVEYGSGCQRALVANYSDRSVKKLMCYDITNNTLTQNNVRSGGIGGASYTMMTDATVGSCVNYISGNTFNGCTSLSAVTFQGSVYRISGSSFENCTSLTSITIPNSTYFIGAYAFRYDGKLRSVTFPSNLETLGSYAFYGCSGLTSISLPDNYLYTISAHTFEHCSGATSIHLPNKCTTIQESAFYNCNRLRYLTIPSGVTSIASNAFSQCYGLYGIYCSGETAPTLGSGVFDGTNNCPIYLPSCSSYASYYNKWSSYRNRMVLPSDCPTGIAIDLNNQWSGSTSYGNLSSASTQYYFYESFSNWHVPSSTATTYLTCNNAGRFSFYVRNYAESTYDYVIVYLDGSQIYNGSNKQSATNWNLVTVNARGGIHLVKIDYKKDSSVDTGDDRGYIAIPKDLICTDSETRWIDSGERVCLNGNLYAIEKEQWRCVGESTWIDNGNRRTGSTSYGECQYNNLDYIVKDSSHNGMFENTGIVLKDNTRFEIKVYPTYNGGGAIFGELNAPSDNDDYRIFWSSGSLYYDYGSSRTYTSCSLNNLYRLEVGNDYVKNLDTGNYLVNRSTKSGVAQSHVRNIGILNGGADYARLYYLKVYEGDTLIRNYIPVRNSYNNVVTLYDTVNGNFLDVTSGTFKGSDE